jgi:hypothetical protein
MAFVVDDHVRQLALAQQVLVNHLREICSGSTRQVALAAGAGHDHRDGALLADHPQRPLLVEIVGHHQGRVHVAVTGIRDQAHRQVHVGALLLRLPNLDELAGPREIRPGLAALTRLIDYSPDPSDEASASGS